MNPQYRGYCVNCVRKMKEEYDKRMEIFTKMSTEYEVYCGQDQSQAENKIRLMKNKIEQYNIKLNCHDMVNIFEKHQVLMGSEEAKTHAEFRVTV